MKQALLEIEVLFGFDGFFYFILSCVGTRWVPGPELPGSGNYPDPKYPVLGPVLLRGSGAG